MSIEVHNETDTEIDSRQFKNLAAHTLNTLHVHPDADLSIIFTDEHGITQLNEQWLGAEGPTDVLSFPMDELRPGRADAQTPSGLLGDIVICPEIAKVQAMAAGHTQYDEMLLLLTHGILHLLGFDHATPVEEAEMFGLQAEILLSFEEDV